MQKPLNQGTFNPKDYCIEVREENPKKLYQNIKAHKNKVLCFEVFVTRRSDVKHKDIISGKSLLITSPEFRDFLQNTNLGVQVIQQLANPAKKVFSMGHAEVLKESKRMYYTTFYPYGYAAFQFPPSYSYKSLTKKGLGALIDAQILKHLGKKYPGERFAYGASFSSIRKKKLKKRGVKKPYAFLPVEEHYKNLKLYLKKKSEERFALERQKLALGKKRTVRKSLRRV